MKGKGIMAIKIGNYNFDGPHHQTGVLLAQSGVYVILGKTGNTNWVVLDVGESHCVRERVENHDRRSRWAQRGHRELAVAALYVVENQRMVIERELRSQFNPPCGER
jgi:hypothetical protein